MLSNAGRKPLLFGRPRPNILASSMGNYSTLEPVADRSPTSSNVVETKYPQAI